MRDSSAARRAKIISDGEARMAKASGGGGGGAAPAAATRRPKRVNRALSRFAPVAIKRTVTTTGSAPVPGAAAPPTLRHAKSAAPRLRKARAARSSVPLPAAQRVRGAVFAKLAPSEAKLRRDADEGARLAVRAVLAPTTRQCARPSLWLALPLAFVAWGARAERAALAPVEVVDGLGRASWAARSAGFAVCFPPVPLLLALATVRVALSCRALPCPPTAMSALKFLLALIGSISRDLSLCVFCTVLGALGAPLATARGAAALAACAVAALATAAWSGEARARAALRDGALARLRRPHFTAGVTGATLALPARDVRAWAESVACVGSSDRRWGAVERTLRAAHGVAEVAGGHWIVDEVALSAKGAGKGVARLARRVVARAAAKAE